jgi:anti-anti-sigma regulatory factor
MAFSFFKKNPEKMVARPAVNPRAKNGAEQGMTDSLPAPSPEVQTDYDASLDLSDFVFSQSSPDFHVGEEIDPVEAEVQEAAVLFANGQDAAVRSMLENAVRIHPFGPGERLWLMLFDLYRLTANKSAFEALEVEYARSFEKSPPGWQDKSANQPKLAETGGGSLAFRGELTGDNRAAFDAIVQSIGKSVRLRLDLSKVTRLDAQGCGRLLAVLQQARKRGCALSLTGRDALSALLQECIVAGEAENRECWLLYLELCQLDGLCEIFEDMAVQFAVTFEVSPPSWEAARVASPGLSAKEKAEVSNEPLAGDAYHLRGEIKALRFADLIAYAEVHNPVMIDCSELSRIDFISAGAMLNSLTTIGQSGKTVVLHHPNRLVAELFGVIGLTALVSIIFAKY